MSLPVTVPDLEAVAPSLREQDLFAQVTAMQDSFVRGEGTASAPFQAVRKFVLYVSELSQNEQRFRQQSEAQAEILEVMKHIMAEREAVIHSQSQEAADMVVRHKRKADEDSLNQSKRHCESTDRINELAAANNVISAATAELQSKNAELEVTNAQLEASINALQFECCVCTDARPSVLYLPCKHLSVCDTCDTQVKDAKMPCPICQTAIKARHAGVRL